MEPLGLYHMTRVTDGGYHVLSFCFSERRLNRSLTEMEPIGVSVEVTKVCTNKDHHHHPPGAQRAATGGGGTPIDAVTGHDDVLLYVNLLCGGVRIPSTAALHPVVGPVQA